MTKADLIEEVSRVVEMTRKDSEVIVEAIFDSIVRALRGADKIEIRGFGSFRTRQRQSRVGRNPKTGTRVDVPAKKIPYFKPSKELKDLVNTSQHAETPAAPPPAPPAAPNPATPAKLFQTWTRRSPGQSAASLASSFSLAKCSWPSGICSAAGKVVMVFSLSIAKSLIWVSFLVLLFSGTSIHHSSCP